MSIWTDLMGHEVRQTFYDAGGVRTRCIEAGAGKPLIFLHGTGGHAEAYAPNIVAHAKHFHVYAVDMVGHGYTATPDIEYSYDDYVKWLADFCDAIGARRVIVSGESLGAMIAELFAIRFAERAEKIVLNTGILWPPDAAGRKELLDFVERSKAAAGATITREAVRSRLEWLMYDPQKSVTDELVEVRYRIYSQPGRAPVLRKIAGHVLNRILSDEFARDYCAPEFVARVKCPALALWTRHNPSQSIAVAEAGMKHMPNARMVIMEQSAHWPQWEEPELFNRLHLEFLLG